MRISIVFWIAVVSLVSLAGGAFVGGLRTLGQDDSEVALQRVETLLSIDDRAGATSLLQSHILDYPDDWGAQLRLSELLSDTGQEASAIRILRHLLRNEALYVDHFDTHDAARLSHNKMTISRDRDLRGRGTRTLESGDRDEALAAFRDLLTLWADDPYLCADFLIADLVPQSPAHATRALASLNYMTAGADWAYALWRSSDPSFLDTLSFQSADACLNKGTDGRNDSILVTISAQSGTSLM